MSLRSVVGLALWVAVVQGCEAEAVQAPTAVPAAPTPSPEPKVAQPAPAAPERSFGAAPKLAGAPLDVAQVLANPEPHFGKVIKCEGVVARVCERAGCWLELRAPEGNDQGLRVPMAGHAFFIPQDAVGKTAVVEGELISRPLSPGERAHLEGEGLKANGPISLAATSVVLR